MQNGAPQDLEKNIMIEHPHSSTSVAVPTSLLGTRGVLTDLFRANDGPTLI